MALRRENIPGCHYGMRKMGGLKVGEDGNILAKRLGHDF